MMLRTSSWLRWIGGFLLMGAMLAIGTYGYYAWQEKKAMEEMVAPGLNLINYTDDEVYTSVRNSKFPEPGQGASYDMGPNTGGAGLVCCVPVPVQWQPGIKMDIHYRFGRWPEDKWEIKVIELPEYLREDAGDLYLVFYSENDFELVNSRYSPSHAKWPGRRVEEIKFGE